MEDYELVDWTKTGKRCADIECLVDPRFYNVDKVEWEVTIKNMHAWLAYEEDYMVAFTAARAFWDMAETLAGEEINQGQISFSNDFESKFEQFMGWTAGGLMTERIDFPDTDLGPASSFTFHVSSHDGQWWIEA